VLFLRLMSRQILNYMCNIHKDIRNSITPKSLTLTNNTRYIANSHKDQYIILKVQVV